MQALRFIEPGNIQQVEIPEPDSPGAGEALVRVHQVGVCGTDISGYLGKHPFFTYPRIPGHELGVEVLEVGAGVENVKPGDRCAVEPYMNNPDSFASRRGLTNCCQEVEVIGVHVDGGLCDRIKIRADKLHPASGLQYEQLALVETLAIGCHACNRSEAQQGDRVLVIGVGPIGCSVIEFLRIRGCEIATMDLNPDRLEMIRGLYGIEHLVSLADGSDGMERVRDITSGEGFDYVIDATGSPKSMSFAPNYVRHGGTFVCVGNTTEEITFSHSLLQKPELTIKMSRNALPEDFAFIIKTMEAGSIDTNAWITHRTTLAEVADVFPSFTKPESGVLKAMIAV